MMHHPKNRAERIKLKLKKLQKHDRPSHSRRRELEEVKTREADNELRKEIRGIPEVNG